MVTPTDVALFHDTDESVGLDQIIAALPQTDLVLVEGFHLEPRAKIEVLSDRNEERHCKMDENLLAIVAPTARESAVPRFEPSSLKSLADLIEREVLGKPGFPVVTKNSNFEVSSVS